MAIMMAGASCESRHQLVPDVEYYIEAPEGKLSELGKGMQEKDLKILIYV